MTSNPTLFLLPDAEKFNGSNWQEFKETMLNAADARGLLGCFGHDKKIIPKPTGAPASIPSETTNWWGALHLTPEEWEQRNAYAKGMIALNVKNPIGVGLMTQGTAAEAWESLISIHDQKSALKRIQLEDELKAIKYIEGTDIKIHFATLRLAWSRANEQGSSIGDEEFGLTAI